MNRKNYLKKRMIIGGISLALLVVSCSQKDTMIINTVASGGNVDCLISPVETVGEFPTRNPNMLVREDITADRQGVPMTINLLIANSDNNCTPIENAQVDIWYCDADGNFSEYTFNSSLHFLRGRQTTNSEGLVSFRGIFPGWFIGRAPHIYVRIYDQNDNYLTATQIAFPKDVCDTVYTTATNFYKKGKQDTTNENDEIFRDNITLQLGKVEGTVFNGFTLTHTIAL